eukprot:CAMPEP_0184490872 /NCGR_PEP_ID=MMETSP0113_2-20130426/19132_1 /TAXON_ID=91329 /ORGANISM="Norrisiella sphaerica, Strain BC52" /LENGTH=75 /DNA_ID=CAMNT_0026874993 /DNA_START=1124 /DNA_END=1348 /DNA_ORIENTATION=-
MGFKVVCDDTGLALFTALSDQVQVVVRRVGVGRAFKFRLDGPEVLHGGPNGSIVRTAPAREEDEVVKLVEHRIAG